jgi:predicted TIM-barrel fold metal-dependent hydrolase
MAEERRFGGVGTVDYPIIDADSHVNEPPELWQERLPADLRDRGPVLVHGSDGDVWHFEGGRSTRALGLTAAAGLSDLEIRPAGRTYADTRPASWDPKARLAEMALDGIFAQVLYPSITLTGAAHYSGDPVLQVACVRAYNDWLREFCADGEGRLVGIAVMPMCGVDACVDELEWAQAHGLRGVMLSTFPNGTVDPSPEDDRFWAAAASAGLPVSIHIGGFSRVQPNPAAASRDNLPFLAQVAASHAGSETIPLVVDLLFAGVLDRFPALQVVLVEANIGWIPSVLEQTDDTFLRYRWFTGAALHMPNLPSRLFHRHVWSTFMTDSVGLELRHRLNLDHIMWSSDYPHSVTSWPDSRRVIAEQLHDLTDTEARKILHDNCRQLYRLDHLPTSFDVPPPTRDGSEPEAGSSPRTLS